MNSYLPLIEMGAKLRDFLEGKLLMDAILRHCIDKFPRRLPYFCNNEKTDDRFADPSTHGIMGKGDGHIYVVSARQPDRTYYHTKDNALNNLLSWTKPLCFVPLNHIVIGHQSMTFFFQLLFIHLLHHSLWYF